MGWLKEPQKVNRANQGHSFVLLLIQTLSEEERVHIALGPRPQSQIIGVTFSSCPGWERAMVPFLIVVSYPLSLKGFTEPRTKAGGAVKIY